MLYFILFQWLKDLLKLSMTETLQSPVTKERHTQLHLQLVTLIGSTVLKGDKQEENIVTWGLEENSSIAKQWYTSPRQQIYEQ
jgi:hypothetical protein